jgi:L-2-hydroxyglutarate oxidase LhgO
MNKQLVTQALPFEGAVAGDIMKAELSESFKRQQKLAEAVEADDTAAIKSLMPELLKDYVKQTEELRELTKKLKTEIPAPAVK